CGTPISFYC
nr:Chain B, Microcin J25 [Escherichia coli]5T56_D Chain D, Microcin J25 [Escherichia coli]